MGGRTVMALGLFLSVALIGALGISLTDEMLEQVQEQRLQSVTSELRARLETSLRIGLALSENDHIQPMLEEVAARAALDSIEIDSESGTVLFSTDRALRGQPVPASWREAARANPRGWHSVRRDEHSVGTPLHDALGQPAGFLVWSRQEARDIKIADSLFIDVLWIAAGTAVLAFLAGAVIERMARARRAVDLWRLKTLDPIGSDAIALAGCVMEEARAELARVDHDAHRIAGIDQ